MQCMDTVAEIFEARVGWIRRSLRHHRGIELAVSRRSWVIEPWVKGLGLAKFVPSSFGPSAGGQQLQCGPAAPQDEPAGRLVAFAVLVPSQTSEGQEEVFQAPART